MRGIGSLSSRSQKVRSRANRAGVQCGRLLGMDSKTREMNGLRRSRSFADQKTEICKMSDAEPTYVFEGGYPNPETIQRAYDDADLTRAIQAYKFFYPTVSIEATWRGNIREGAVTNQVFALLEGTPKQLVFTPNSDTPYSGLPLDLSEGPLVIELPRAADVPGRGAGENRQHARSRPRSYGDARSAAPPRRYSLTATQSHRCLARRRHPGRCGFPARHSAEAARRAGSRDRRSHGHDDLARLEGAVRAHCAAQAALGEAPRASSAVSYLSRALCSAYRNPRCLGRCSVCILARSKRLGRGLCQGRP
jgi:hypothetical protein